MLGTIVKTMNQTILLLTLLTFFSCYTNKKSDDKRISDKNTISEIDSSTYLKNKLIGEWGIYVTIVGGIEATCNVCPKVKFETNNQAIFTFPSGEREFYKWEVKGNRLVMTAIENRNLNADFPDAGYKMNFTNKKNFIELRLMETEKKCSKILRRH